MIESISGTSLGSRSGPLAAQPRALTDEQQRQIQALKEIDRKVRAHEQAHLRVGGDLVRGGATYSYEVGPDEKRYAVSGEVSIDASPARTPEETIPKAQHIRATALAPVDPSSQDRAVAAAASAMESEARIQVAAQKRSDAEPSSTPARSSASEQSGARIYADVASTGERGSLIGMWLNAFA